jgi:plasmid stabilization system protein ParE
MGNFVLLPPAQADLGRLVASLGDPKSSLPAKRALDTHIRAFENVEAFPMTGMAIRPPYRQHAVRFGKYGFVMRYRIMGDVVFITRLWHGREDRL